MLSKNQVVLARKQVERMYIGKCDVIAYEKIKKPNKATKLGEVLKHKNTPCRLVYLNVAPTTETNAVSGVKQIIQLHIAPEIDIPTGCKIIVSQNGQTTEYKSSGEPAVMLTHQEVKLELFKGWS